MRYYFSFARKAASDANLTNGTATYNLPSDFFAIDQVQQIDTDGDPQYTLDFIPWARFNITYNSQDDTGRPTIWTLRSAYEDETIRLYPVPDSAAATDWDLRLNYYRRITVPTQESDLITGPEELEVPLCLYAESYVEQVHGDKNLAVKKMNDYKDAVKLFRSSHENEPDDMLGFFVAEETTRKLDTTLYIKIG